MKTVDNFYNKVAKDIMEKYFPTIKWHRDNFASQKAMYQLELFNNGCLNYTKLVKKLSKYCMTTKEEIEQILTKYIKLN